MHDVAVLQRCAIQFRPSQISTRGLPVRAFGNLSFDSKYERMSIHHADFRMGIKNRLGSLQSARREQVIGRYQRGVVTGSKGQALVVGS